MLTVLLFPVSKSAEIKIRILPPFSSSGVLWDNILILTEGGPQGEEVSVTLWPGQVPTRGAENEMKVPQTCLTLCHPMSYTAHGILPGQNTGVGSLSLLQGIFPTQESNLGLLQSRQILYQLNHEGSPTPGAKGMENPWTRFLFTIGIILLTEVQVALSPEHWQCVSSEQICLTNYGFLRVIF